MGVLTERNEGARTMEPPQKARHMPAPAPAGDDCLTFGRLDGKAVPDGPSPQDAFKRFRSERSHQVKTQREPASKLKVRAAARRATDPVADNLWLRKKFIEAVNKHQEGDELGATPLWNEDCLRVYTKALNVFPKIKKRKGRTCDHYTKQLKAAPDGALPSCAAAQTQARAVPPYNCDRLSDVCARAWRRYKERLAALSTPVEVGPATLRFELLPLTGHRHNKFAVPYVTAC